eukprot:4785511-Amphidinium_carterae.1
MSSNQAAQESAIFVTVHIGDKGAVSKQSKYPTLVLNSLHLLCYCRPFLPPFNPTLTGRSCINSFNHTDA